MTHKHFYSAKRGSRVRLMFGVLDFLLRNYAPPAYSLQVSQGKSEKIKETMEDYDKPPTFIHLTPSSVSSVFFLRKL